MDAFTVIWIVVSIIFCALFGMSMMKAIKREESRKRQQNKEL